MLPYTATSLFDVISDNKYKATNLGKEAWLNLMKGSKIQTACLKEGFNVKFGDANSAKIRIGIIGDNTPDCAKPDSRLGFGGAGSTCNQQLRPCGNEARCLGTNVQEMSLGAQPGIIMAARDDY